MLCGNCQYADVSRQTNELYYRVCTITGEHRFYSDSCNCQNIKENKIEALEYASKPGTTTIKWSEPVFKYGTPCLVCGESVPINPGEGQKICATCKKVIKFIKENFKEELDKYEM